MRSVRVLDLLRAKIGEVATDDELTQQLGCSRETLKVHVHHLREAGHVVDRAYGRGYVLRSLAQHRPAPRPEPVDVVDGVEWRPEHEGDPLLDALRANHKESEAL